MLIPKTFHYIWLGSPLPKEIARRRETWAKIHPGWTMKLWTEENIVTDYADLAAKCGSYAQRADLYRYEILHREGGIYIDVDFECLRNVEEMLNGLPAFAVIEHQGRPKPQVSAGFIGTIPKHPAYAILLREVPHALEPGKFTSIGPDLFTKIVVGRKDVRIFPKPTVYPSNPDQRSKARAFHHPRSQDWKGDGAEFVYQRIPVSMWPGETLKALVVIKNTGKTAWCEEEKSRLGFTRPLDSSVWGKPRRLLPFGHIVKPGENAEFTFPITAPDKPGTYSLQWGMVREGVWWFGDKTPVTKIRVATPVPASS